MRLLVLLTSVVLGVFCAEPVKPARPPSQQTVRVPVVSALELRQASLKASLIGSKPARVTRLRSPKDDLLILLVTDLTGDLALVDSARVAITEQLKSLSPKTWVGLLRSQDGFQALVDPTNDRAKVTTALTSMAVNGKAGLLDTAETAMKIAGSIAAKSAVRLAVLYVTDSDVRNYREDFTNPVINSSDSRDLSRRFPEGLVREKIARTAETLAGYQTPMYIVHLDYSSERLNQAYQTGLMQMATATGGKATFARSPADVPDLIAQAFSSMQALWEVWVQLPPKSAKNVQLVIEHDGQPLEHRSQFILK